MFPRTEFEKLVATLDARAMPEALSAAKEGDADALTYATAATVRAAFSSPAAARPLYDAIANAWLGGGDAPSFLPELPGSPIGKALWDEFWSAIEVARTVSYTPWTLVARITAVARQTHPDFLTNAVDATVRRFGPDPIFGAALEPELDAERWRSCQPDTLGATLASMVEEGRYVVEVGALREQRTLPPRLARLHGHVDPLEGVWRAVAGYDSTESHLIAFMAFQLAQCGHLFSASALALLVSLTHFGVHEGMSIVLHIISEGWRHGRNAPPLLPISWRPHWDEPVEPIRARYGIPAYRSLFSRNLVQILGTNIPERNRAPAGGSA